MIRNFFSTFTAFSLLALGACSDKGGETSNVTGTDGTTEAATTDGTGTTAEPTTEPGTTTTTTTPTTTTEPTTTTTDPTTTTTTTEPGTTTTTTEPATTTDSGTTVEPGTTTDEPETSTTTEGDPIQVCLGDVEPPDDACGICACEECIDQLLACQVDEGCTAIRACAEESGCNGANCLGPCGAIINMHGGVFGNSVKLGQDIVDCLNDGCPGLCT